MFIKRKDIEFGIPVSRRASKELFDKYRHILIEQNKKQLSDDMLPKEWFLKNFSSDYGINLETFESTFNDNLIKRKENENDK